MAKKGTKRSAQGTGTIRKKTVVRNGKTYTYWEGRITIGLDPGTGKQKQRSFTGQTQAEVVEKMQAASASIKDQTYLDPSRMTVGEWADIWLSSYMSDKKYQTIRGYKAQVNEHIKPAFGAVKLQKLTPVMIQSFYQDLAVSGRTTKKKDEKTGKVTITKAPLSPKTIRNIHAILSKCLNTAIDVGYLKTNPADRAVLPRKGKNEMCFLTDGQIKALFNSEDEYIDLYKLYVLTGMREMELLGLTWNHVDFANKRITISQQLIQRSEKDGGFITQETKSDNVRVITPAPIVFDILKKSRTKQAEQKLMAGELWQGWQNESERKKALCFMSDLGDNLRPKTIRTHFKKLADAIGVPECRIHDLRHTHAVISAQNGVDWKTISQNLGHSDVAFTINRYGHVSVKMNEDCSAKIQNYIDNLGA